MHNITQWGGGASTSSEIESVEFDRTYYKLIIKRKDGTTLEADMSKIEERLDDLVINDVTYKDNKLNIELQGSEFSVEIPAGISPTDWDVESDAKTLGLILSDDNVITADLSGMFAGVTGNQIKQMSVENDVLTITLDDDTTKTVDLSVLRNAKEIQGINISLPDNKPKSFLMYNPDTKEFELGQPDIPEPDTQIVTEIITKKADFSKLDVERMIADKLSNINVNVAGTIVPKRYTVLKNDKVVPMNSGIVTLKKEIDYSSLDWSTGFGQVMQVTDKGLYLYGTKVYELDLENETGTDTGIEIPEGLGAVSTKNGKRLVTASMKVYDKKTDGTWFESGKINFYEKYTTPIFINDVGSELRVMGANYSGSRLYKRKMELVENATFNVTYAEKADYFSEGDHIQLTMLPYAKEVFINRHNNNPRIKLDDTWGTVNMDNIVFDGQPGVSADGTMVFYIQGKIISMLLYNDFATAPELQFKFGIDNGETPINLVYNDEKNELYVLTANRKIQVYTINLSPSRQCMATKKYEQDASIKTDDDTKNVYMQSMIVAERDIKSRNGSSELSFFVEDPTENSGDIYYIDVTNDKKTKIYSSDDAPRRTIKITDNYLWVETKMFDISDIDNVTLINTFTENDTDTFFNRPLDNILLPNGDVIFSGVDGNNKTKVTKFIRQDDNTYVIDDNFTITMDDDSKHYMSADNSPFTIQVVNNDTTTDIIVDDLNGNTSKVTLSSANYIDMPRMLNESAIQLVNTHDNKLATICIEDKGKAGLVAEIETSALEQINNMPMGTARYSNEQIEIFRLANVQELELYSLVPA